MTDREPGREPRDAITVFIGSVVILGVGLAVLASLPPDHYLQFASQVLVAVAVALIIGSGLSLAWRAVRRGDR